MLKSTPPTAAQLQYRKALEGAMQAHGQSLDASELLAITAHLVGQLMAMQDQRTMTPDAAIELVQSNIVQGNREVVANLLNQSGGHA